MTDWIVTIGIAWLAVCLLCTIGVFGRFQRVAFHAATAVALITLVLALVLAAKGVGLSSRT